MSPPPEKRPYHHGNLRAMLVSSSLEVMRETGVHGFSVAQAAKRAGVSSAAPYRHFADREALVAACATVIAGDLADALGDAADAAGPDPRERFAATAGAYARFVIEHHVGLDLLYSDGMQDRRYADLHVQTRRLQDLLFTLAQELPGTTDPLDALNVQEAHLAAAHGFALLQLQGGFAQFHRGTEDVARRATEAARTLLLGVASREGSGSA